MDAAKFERVVLLFEAGREVPAADRAAWLASVAADDEEVARRVGEMLAVEDADALEREVPGWIAADLLRDGDVAAGQLVGAFELVEMIASGGMGAVWRARQATPAREVALKILHPWWVGGEVAERFEFEAKALASLRSPAFPAVFVSGSHDERVWIAMELVEGRTLSAWRAEVGPPPDVALTLLIDLCRAIGELHRAGLVHRDVKPDNVLISPDGKVRVVDLGASFGLDDEERVGRQAIGTAPYASPEQHGGFASSRSDVYALGVLGTWLLPVAAPAGETGALPEDVAVVLRRAVSQAPEERYADAVELADDLILARDHLPVSGAAGGAMYRLRLWQRRHRRMLVAALTAVLIAGTAAGLAAAGRAWDRWRAHREASAQLEARVASAATGDAEALREVVAFVSSADALPVQRAGWVAIADLARGAGELEQEVDALAKALGAEPGGTSDAAVLERTTKALLERWAFASARAAGRAAGQYSDTELALAVLASDRDLAGMAALMAPDDPRRPIAAALAFARDMGGRREIVRSPGGPLYEVDRAAGELVRLTLDLTPLQSWRIPDTEIGWPRTHIVELDPPMLVAYSRTTPHRSVAWRLDPDGVPREVGRWTSFGEHRLVVDRFRPAVRVLVGSAYPHRMLAELVLEGSWRPEFGRDPLSQFRSDIMDIELVQLDDDAPEELIAGQGPWWGYGVRRMDRLGDGSWTMTAGRSLGFVNDVDVIDTAVGRRVVALASHRYANGSVLGEATPYGPPAGVYLLDPADLAIVDHFVVPEPVIPGERPGYVHLYPGDIDGDGLQDLAVAVDFGADQHLLVLRQLADGALAGLFLPGMMPMAVADLDGDGDAEVVVGEWLDAPTTWALGVGDRALPPRPDGLPAQPAPTSLRGAGARDAWQRAHTLRLIGRPADGAQLLLDASRRLPSGDRDILVREAGALAEAAPDDDLAVRAWSLALQEQPDEGLARRLLDAARVTVDPVAMQRAAAALAGAADGGAIAEAARRFGAPPSLAWSGASRSTAGGVAWEIRRPSSVRHDARGSMDLSLLTGQAPPVALPMTVEGERVGFEVEFQVAHSDAGTSPQLALVRDGETYVGMQLLNYNDLPPRVGCLSTIGQGKEKFPLHYVGSGTVRLRMDRSQTGTRCEIEVDGQVHTHVLRSPPFSTADAEFVPVDTAPMVGTPLSTLSRIKLIRIEVWGAVPRSAAIEPAEREGCGDPERCLLAALELGAVRPAHVEAVLASDDAAVVLHTLLRTAPPHHRALIRDAVPPARYAALMFAAWAGATIHAPPSVVIDVFDRDWARLAAPDDLAAKLVLSRLGLALADEGQAAAAAKAMDRVFDYSDAGELSEVNYAELLVLRAQVDVQLGDRDAARERLARARSLPWLRESVDNLVATNPVLAGM